MSSFSIHTALAASFLASCVLAGAMFYVSRLPAATPAMRWWAAAFLLNSLRFCLSFAAPWIGRDLAVVGSESAHAGMIVLLLTGTIIFAGRQASKSLTIGLLVVSVAWILHGVATAQAFLVLTGPLYLLAGAVVVATGLLFLRQHGPESLASERFVGWCFLIAGLHKLNYPFLRPIEWFAPFGFFIAQTLMLMIAVGLIILVQQRQQAELRRASSQARTEEARRLESEERLAGLAEHLPGIIYRRRLSPDGTITYSYMSPSIENLTGLSATAYMTETNALAPCLHPEDSEGWNAALQHSARTLTPMDHQFRIVSLSNGVVRWFHTLAKPRRLPDGSVTWDGVTLDVTSRKELEAQLRLAKDQAESANAAKSEFLANMSHELRTPLNAIIGFAEMIQKQMIGPLGNPRYSEYAEDINGSAHHLLAIINDILDLSKVEAGKLTPEMGATDAAEVIRDCLNGVARSARASDVHLDFDLPESCSIVSDARMLRQVLLNLLTNAIKFTPQGGCVWISLEEEEPDGLTIRIRDNGIGMTREHARRALEPFYQVESTLTRRYEGTGLGLPLVDRFAQLLGGRLTLTSELGEGTEAVVRLPRWPGLASAAEVPERLSA